ncbi:kinetochore protein spc24-like isoform X2 [Panulirus ornatus]
MQGCEEKTVIEKECEGLDKMRCEILSLFANNKVNSYIISAKDILTSESAKADRSQQSLKESIKDLLHVEEKETTTLDDLRSQAMGLQASQLLSQVSQAKRNKSEIEKEIESLVASIKHKEQLDQQLDNRAKSSSHHISAAIPKIKADVNTFSKISRLKWDYSAPDDMVKGFILRAEKKDIVPFKFDKSLHSQFFITNFLWQQIGSDNDFL